MEIRRYADIPRRSGERLEVRRYAEIPVAQETMKLRIARGVNRIWHLLKKY